MNGGQKSLKISGTTLVKSPAVQWCQVISNFYTTPSFGNYIQTLPILVTTEKKHSPKSDTANLHREDECKLTGLKNLSVSIYKCTAG